MPSDRTNQLTCEHDFGIATLQNVNEYLLGEDVEIRCIWRTT